LAQNHAVTLLEQKTAQHGRSEMSWRLPVSPFRHTERDLRRQVSICITLYVVIAAGIFFACRRTGWFVFIYVSIVICPVFFSPSTIIFGVAANGISMAWLANLPSIRKPLTSWALRWLDTSPGWFYSFSFILTYQMAELFDPMLKTLKVAKFIIQGKPLCVIPSA
jgi:hypothetical protein